MLNVLSLHAGDFIFNKNDPMKSDPSEEIGRIIFHIQYENEKFTLSLLHKDYEQKLCLNSLPETSASSIMNLLKIKSTPSLQLVAVGIALAKKLKLENEDGLAERFQMICDEGINDRGIVADFVKTQLTQEAITSLMDNNCLNSISLASGDRVIIGHYIPCTPPLKFITEVSAKVIELWEKIKR